MNTVKYINRAIVASAHGRGDYVFYHGTGTGNPARIMDCRSRRGTLQVKFLSTGVWVDVRGNDYVTVGSTRYNAPTPAFAIRTVAELRDSVPDFFGRGNKRFFGDTKYGIANGIAGTFLIVKTRHSTAIYRFVPATATNAADLMFAAHGQTYEHGRELARRLATGEKLAA